jgi:hypothetical protein
MLELLKRVLNRVFSVSRTTVYSSNAFKLLLGVVDDACAPFPDHRGNRDPMSVVTQILVQLLSWHGEAAQRD